MPRILLVDDDKDLLRISQRYLKQEEPTYEFTATESAHEALQALKMTRFDAIVADYQMPGMDGLELLEYLRREGNNIPFIIFTGRGREEVAIRALNLGADHYLRKGGESKSLFGELAHIINQLVHHQRTEQALQEARSHAQKYLDIAAVMIVAITADGTVSLINQRGSAILGYSEEEIIGKNWFDTFIPARMRDEVQSVFIELMKGNIEPAEDFENPVITKSGEERTIAWHNTILTENDTIVGTLSSGEDITERKQAEEELRESQRRFMTIFENANDGIVNLDSSGKILDVNRKALELYAGSKAELLGQNFLELDIFSPGDKEELARNFEQLVSGQTDFLEISMTNKEGQVLDLECSGFSVVLNDKALGVAVFIRDRTARKEAMARTLQVSEKQTKELQESEELFQAIFEQSPTAIEIYDPMGELIAANSECLALFGVKKLQEVIGFKLFDDPNLPVDAKERLLAGEAVGFESEFDFELVKKHQLYKTSKTGRCFLNILITPLGVAGEPPEGYLVHVSDITLHHQKEEELSDFAHSMAHDLRNRLVAIEGYAALLQKEHNESYIEKIGNLAKDMNELLYRSVMLADAGLVIEKTDLVELTQLVQEVAESVIPDNVSFRHDPLPAVRADRHKLAQVFQNLFENAVIHAKPRKIEVRRRDTKDSIRIWITNDGTPIPSENRSKVFRRGFTTKADGTGLGLNISQRVIEAHGWRIRLENAPDTTFSIAIPINS
ncbi:MAG: PAS domain S-box protein [Candidatus Thorarchaeota archaeon]